MRYYVWYSPEIDVIVLQCIMESCRIGFEWDAKDLYEHLNHPGIKIDHFQWIPLGEL